MRVPEQVAVIGADNDQLICAIASPPLTSVIIDDEKRGYEAAAMLDRLMQGEEIPPRRSRFFAAVLNERFHLE
jgi:LacI family transcriptional regulator